MNNVSLPRILFILLPLLEIAVFVAVGKLIGVGLTLLLIIASTLFGAKLLSNGGFGQLHTLLNRTQPGEQSSQPAAHGLLLVLSGFLLLIPGFITDLVGVLLLIPRLRAVAIKWFMKKSPIPNTPTASSLHHGTTLDGEYTRDN